MGDKQVSVFALQESVSVSLSDQVFSQLLVGLDELLDGPFSLVEVDLLHLVAMHNLLEIVDLLSESFLGRDLVLLASTLGVFPFESLALSPEFLNDSLERFNEHLELANALATLGSQSDGLFLLFAILSCFASDLLDFFVIRFLLCLDGSRELGRALLVLLELLDSLLKSSILKIVRLFLELEVKKLLFCLEVLLLDVYSSPLACLEFFFQLSDSHLPEELQLLSLL